MMIKKMLKKVTLPLLLAGAISGCGPEGVPIKGDYPPLTQERKERLEELATECQENNCQIVLKNPKVIMATEDGRTAIDFQGYPKEIINRIYGFIDEDYLMDKIIEPKGFVNIVSKYEVEKRCDKYKDIKEEGCSKKIKDTILLKNEFNLSEFLIKISHENAHLINYNKKEFLSVAFENLIPIKTYMFSKIVGSPLTDFLTIDYFNNYIPEEYQKGALLFIEKLSRNEGNIKKTIDYIKNTSLNKLNKIKLDDAKKRYYESWEIILESNQFYLKLREYLSVNETNEYIDYIKILNFINNKENNKKFQDYYNLLSKFANNENYQNNYFKRKINKKIELMDNWLN